MVAHNLPVVQGSAAAQPHESEMTRFPRTVTGSITELQGHIRLRNHLA